MIYTVTFNPSLDYIMNVSEIKHGATNRSDGEIINFGGKGINVSYMLSVLGEPSVALGFVGGFTGEELKRALSVSGITTDFITLDEGITRINVKLNDGSITEINAAGPSITEKALDELMGKLDSLTASDTLVLAGSVPKSLPKDIYAKIMSRLENSSVRVVVDAEGKLLVDTLKYRPFLIKPNSDELCAILGYVPKNDDELVAAAKSLQSMGAKNVLVSLGADGALLLDELSAVRRIKAPRIEPKSTVGAGDSMIAGFLAGLNNGYEYALKLGIASGSASAASFGLADIETVNNLLENME